MRFVQWYLKLFFPTFFFVGRCAGTKFASFVEERSFLDEIQGKYSGISYVAFVLLTLTNIFRNKERATNAYFRRVLCFRVERNQNPCTAPYTLSCMIILIIIDYKTVSEPRWRLLLNLGAIWKFCKKQYCWNLDTSTIDVTCIILTINSKWFIKYRIFFAYHQINLKTFI